MIASFLGAQAITRHGLADWVVLALVAFGVSVALSIYVLLPKDGLIFALDAPETYEALYEVRDDETEMHRRLTYWVQTFREENHPTVQRLTRAFEAAGVALLMDKPPPPPPPPPPGVGIPETRGGGANGK